MLTMIFGVSYVAFSCLALRQTRHWQAVAGAKAGPSPARWLLGILGVLLLVASFVLSLAHEGTSYGILLWVTSLTMTAFGVVATLAFRPRFLRPVAWMTSGLLRIPDRVGRPVNPPNDLQTRADNRALTVPAIAFGASSGMAKQELALISHST